MRVRIQPLTVGYEVPIIIMVKTNVTAGSAMTAEGQNQMITAAMITPIEFKRSPRTCNLAPLMLMFSYFSYFSPFRRGSL